ncbi:unnamed protein product, partial [Brenthis ino]
MAKSIRSANKNNDTKKENKFIFKDIDIESENIEDLKGIGNGLYQDAKLAMESRGNLRTDIKEMTVRYLGYQNQIILRLNAQRLAHLHTIQMLKAKEEKEMNKETQEESKKQLEDIMKEIKAHKEISEQTRKEVKELKEMTENAEKRREQESYADIAAKPKITKKFNQTHVLLVSSEDKTDTSDQGDFIIINDKLVTPRGEVLMSGDTIDLKSSGRLFGGSIFDARE